MLVDLKRASIIASYLLRISPLYFAVFIMRFSFSFTVVALQWLIPNPFDRGVVSAAYPFMEMCSALFLGLVVDRFGRKWIIVTALLCSALVSFSFTLTNFIGSLIVIHAVQGVLASAIVIATLALLTDVAKVSSRGREMGLYDLATIAGYALGFVFAEFLIGGNPFRVYLPFYIGALVALAGGIICALTLKNSKAPHIHKTPSVGTNLKTITGNNATISLIPTWFVLMTVIGVALTYTRELTSVLFLGQSFAIFGGGFTHRVSLRVDLTTVAFVVVGIGIVALSQTSFGSLSDRIGRKKVAFVGQLSLVGLLLTLWGSLAFHFSALILLPLLGIFGLGLLAFAPAALAELADLAPETGRGSTMGLYSLTIGAGTIFGPLVGGALVARLGAAAGLSTLFGFLSLVMVLILIPRFWHKD